MKRGEITIAAAAALAMAGMPACNGQLPHDMPSPDAAPVDTGPINPPPPPPVDAGPINPPVDGGPIILAPVDEEGLPIPGPLPQASGSCTFVHMPSGFTETATWDAAARTFGIGNLYWKLDAQGNTVEYGQTDAQWRHVYTRDDHGMTTTFIYYWQGGVSAENSWDQTNQYDADGRPMTSVLVYRSGTRRVTYDYQYSDGHLLTITTRQEYNGTPSESWTRLIWTGEKLTARESGGGSVASSRQTRFYDDAGRLYGVDVDGAGLGPRIDGTPDLRMQWGYDSTGRLTSAMQDGTEILDAPVVDGIPDDVTVYDASCAQIAAALPLQLYRLPSFTRLR